MDLVYEINEDILPKDEIETYIRQEIGRKAKLVYEQILAKDILKINRIMPFDKDLDDWIKEYRER